MSEDSNSEIRPNWEVELPSYIQRRNIKDTKKDSDSLVAKVQKDYKLTPQEAVAYVTYLPGLDMEFSDYNGEKKI